MLSAVHSFDPERGVRYHTMIEVRLLGADRILGWVRSPTKRLEEHVGAT